jgi:hypothetical protein
LVVEQHSCRFRVEAFGKAVVNRLESSDRVGGTALTAQKPGKAERDPQLPNHGARLSGHLARLVKAVFGCATICTRAADNAHYPPSVPLIHQN